MKRFVALLSLVLFLGSVSTGLAAMTFTSDAAATNASGVMANFRTSSNVTLIALSAAPSYAAFSAHLNGDRQYGSSSGDSQLFFTPKVAGTALATGPTASDSSEFQDEDTWESL